MDYLTMRNISDVGRPGTVGTMSFDLSFSIIYNIMAIYKKGQSTIYFLLDLLITSVYQLITIAYTVDWYDIIM